MNPWIIVVPSALAIGALCGALLRPERAVVTGALVPWIAMLVFLLSQISKPGGALWFIGQLTSGTVVALLGGVSAHFVREWRSKQKNRQRSVRN